MDKRPCENEIHRLPITGYAGDGAGVARLNGVVVFVQGGIRGEVCDVKLTKVGRSAIWGRVVEPVEPSPARQTPDCPIFGRCGGCVYRHMDYAEELQAKRQRVEDALHRIGGLTLPVSEILGAEQPNRYRNKVQFPAGPGPRIGFYQAHTHKVIDAPDCLLQPRPAARLRQAVLQYLTAFQVSVYNDRTGKGLLRHLYVRTNRAGESLCCLLINSTSLPREDQLVEALRRAEPGLRGIVLGINQKKSNVILGDSYRTLWGEDFLMDQLCGLTFQLSVPSFYQVNAAQAEVLYGRAVELAGLTGRETVLDLYCGIGTISLCMARSAGKVYGVEVVPQAVEDARENARRNGIKNAEFFCADAGQAAKKLEADGIRPDVVCVDPPRKGLAPDVVETLAAMQPERIVYVSCDPATLARDLARFASLNYQAQTASAVDLFPRTAHVETVVLLSRGEIDFEKSSG